MNTQHAYPLGHPQHLQTPESPSKLLYSALTWKSGEEAFAISMLLMRADGRLIGRYDKHHRIPFAEYIPLTEQLPALGRRLKEHEPEKPSIIAGETGATVFVEDSLRIGPIICYEALNKARMHAVVRQGPNLLASVVSDAWANDSTAVPMQHLALTIFRAIEARRDLVRAANTRVSAILDALGRVRVRNP